ncbi:MAG: LacI family transcriptional regulator [Lachnospiraceae bacterium]|nr:LacI family transcriptional regulator [Lachnospiraceae bacterium]
MNNVSKAKIADVAKKAGVSVATVSRVINGMENVKEGTKKRVLKAMSELSYSPNALARNLRKNASNAVLVLTPNFTNPYYSHILAGISNCATEKGYSALIVPFNTSEEAERLMKNLLDSNKADGVIILGLHVEDVWIKKYKKQYRMVQCTEYIEDENSIPYIAIDNYCAMYSMTKYIQSMGHKRIALVINDNKFESTKLRLKGFKDAIKESEYKYDFEKYIYYGKDYSFETGVDAATKLLSIPKTPTAILCISDILALGVISGANEMNIEVPRELSVTGFDDVDYTKMFHPFLTTVKQPCYELGVASMELIYKQITGEKFKTDNIIPYELKIRESAIGISVVQA